MNDPTADLDRRVDQELAEEFEVLRVLGEGKTARVYLARERQLRRLVAVKVMLPHLAADEVAPLRFAREAQSAARIAHTNVTSVYQVGKLADGTPYLVMEHVEGGTLADRVEAVGPFGPEEATAVIHDLASALAAAHRRGIIHRDVKPSNVLWKSETGRAMLTDFGLAAVEPSPDHTTRHLTRFGEVIMGDVTFTSPEQLLGEPVSGASDVYAVGCLAWFLLTGQGPFEGKSVMDVAGKHLKAEPPDLRDVPGVPAKLAAWVGRALAKTPGHRPTASDIMEATSADSLASDDSEPDFVLFRALRKRRFVQIMVAYGAVGLGLIEVADSLGQNGIGPPFLYRLVLALYLVGFGAAGVVGWFHGEKGRQEVGKIEVMLLALVGVIAVATSWWVVTR